MTEAVEPDRSNMVVHVHAMSMDPDSIIYSMAITQFAVDDVTTTLAYDTVQLYFEPMGQILAGAKGDLSPFFSMRDSDPAFALETAKLMQNACLATKRLALSSSSDWTIWNAAPSSNIPALQRMFERFDTPCFVHSKNVIQAQEFLQAQGVPDSGWMLEGVVGPAYHARRAALALSAGKNAAGRLNEPGFLNSLRVAAFPYAPDNDDENTKPN